jgi:hypothetical protein
MAARVTEQRRLRELYPADSLACSPSVTRNRTRYAYNSRRLKYAGYIQTNHLFTTFIKLDLHRAFLQHCWGLKDLIFCPLSFSDQIRLLLQARSFLK